MIIHVTVTSETSPVECKRTRAGGDRGSTQHVMGVVLLEYEWTDEKLEDTTHAVRLIQQMFEQGGACC